MTVRTRVLRPRAAFTLVELLVVITIIAVLAGLTAVAVLRTMGTQEQSNSELLLQKVTGTLQQRYSEIYKKALLGETPGAAAVNAAGGDIPRARVLHAKVRMIQRFPMTYAEALNPNAMGIQLPPLPEFARRITRQTAIDPNSESAACLLIALEQIVGGQKFNPDEVLGPGSVKDTDGDGIPEIIDGWGNPVGFFRWGTRATDMSLATNKSASSPLGRDAEDPDHTLMTPAWNQGQFGTMFNTTVHPIRDNLGQGNNPESYFTVPTVISFGKDGKPGVDRWLGVVDAALASDNLYSFRLR